jgi:hypothetical protein
MNWWMIAGGFLMLGASGQAVYSGDWRTSVIFLCYAVANFLLAGVKG